MQSSGDDVSQGTEWKRDERGVYIASRMLEYNHVVNCASRSPHGQGSKGTTLSKIWRNWINNRVGYLCARCTNGRLCCFFVTDRVLVESTGKNGTTVLILTELDIPFIKSTMFRSLISSSQHDQE
mmetsp:Transcript_13200/g.23906  ORF Transcript_13200/g.23906 Transcript_13200/m.23906 type:complete len:125 (-) Transcript_13200:375-749(-)